MASVHSQRLMEVPMARKSGRAPLVLAPEQRRTLEDRAASRTAPVREVERAKVLLGYAAGNSITELQRQLGFSRPMIYRCIDKALAAGVHKSTVWRILDENQIKPHKIRYYLEKRDPQFDRKMQEVLMVYRDVSIYSEGAVHDARPNPIYTVSVDEKPGVQAIGLTAPDLPPVPGKASAVGRDYEYVRRGTVSILAGIDLHSGHIFANVEQRHRSVEFIALLKRLDEYYPSEAIIRVVLDNHSAHISKQTVAYLGTRPGRFEYVHTPKHGSWLNLIECAFSKMARTFLRHMRVKSIDELKARILKGIEEFNASPVVFRWNKFDLGGA